MTSNLQHRPEVCMNLSLEQSAVTHQTHGRRLPALKNLLHVLSEARVLISLWGNQLPMMLSIYVAFILRSIGFNVEVLVLASQVSASRQVLVV